MVDKTNSIWEHLLDAVIASMGKLTRRINHKLAANHILKKL